MRLVVIKNNPMNQKAYLYFHEGTKEGVLIDPGYYPDKILKTINEHNVQLKWILLTHGHYDHITAAASVKEQTGALVYCHTQEKPMLEDHNLNLSVRTDNIVNLSPDHLLEDGSRIEVCDNTIEIIHTPGHTPGGVCFYDKKNATLFTGDTLFKEGIGRSDLPGGDHQELLTMIKTRLLTLPEDVKVYPGHGQESSIGHEKDANPFLR